MRSNRSRLESIMKSYDSDTNENRNEIIFAPYLSLLDPDNQLDRV